MSRPSSNSASGAIGSGSALRVRVRVAVRDERARGASDALRPRARLDVPALGSEHARRPRARTRCRRGASRRRARPSSSTRRTAAASSPTPAENAKRRPLTRPTVIRRVRSCVERLGKLPRRLDRIVRQPERPREHARPAAGQEADRHVALEPVQRLVEAAVAGEDDDRVRARSRHALVTSSVACRGRSVRITETSATRASSASTRRIRSSFTRVAKGLTIRTARATG